MNEPAAYQISINDIIFEMEILVNNTFHAIYPDRVFTCPFVQIIDTNTINKKNEIIITFSVSLINGFEMNVPENIAFGVLGIHVQGQKTVIMKDAQGTPLYEARLLPGGQSWEIMVFQSENMPKEYLQ